MSATSAPASLAPSVPAQPAGPEETVRKALAGPVAAWAVVWGLPAAGVIASLTFGLPVFASLMSGCFLLAAAAVCHRAMVTFTGKALRVLVASRLVVVAIVA